MSMVLGGGTFVVKLEVTDATCNQTFTQLKSITVPACTAPVDLISFTGKPLNQSVQLNWQTAMELNNDHFDLLRSYDGVHFESIANIKGAGNSSQLLNYTYNDFGLSKDKVYYRLDQYDFDGTRTPSKIIIVQLNTSNTIPFNIAPNPFSSAFTLSKFADEKATLFIYDVLGRLIEQQSSGEQERTHVIGEQLTVGSYILKYVSDRVTYSIHIEKK